MLNFYSFQDQIIRVMMMSFQHFATIVSLVLFLSHGYLYAQSEALGTSAKSASQKTATNSKSNSESKIVKNQKAKDAGQPAKIKVDGSAVYEVPNFDSPVIEYMDRGKSVKVSKKIHPGIGGLGAFYKIRVKKGVFGYIADTDVTISKRGSARNEVANEEGDDRLEDDDDPTKIKSAFSEDEEPVPFDSLYMVRYLGFVYYSYGYREEIRNQVEQSATSMMGAKLSGPTNLLGGMPIDVNLLITTSAPEFYSEIASSVSGYMLMADLLATMPLYDSHKFLVFYGAGPVLRYSSWDVKLKEQTGKAPVPSQELGLGLALAAGTAFLITPDVLFRADVKYNYETEKYMGFGAAIQLKY